MRVVNYSPKMKNDFPFRKKSSLRPLRLSQSLPVRGFHTHPLPLSGSLRHRTSWKTVSFLSQEDDWEEAENSFLLFFSIFLSNVYPLSYFEKLYVIKHRKYLLSNKLTFFVYAKVGHLSDSLCALEGSPSTQNVSVETFWSRHRLAVHRARRTSLRRSNPNRCFASCMQIPPVYRLAG